jgi:cation transport ATPase
MSDIATKSLSFLAFQTAPANPQMETDFLTLAASLAVQSSHPAAGEIVRIARVNSCPQCPVIGFRDFPGDGFGGAVQLPGESAPRAVLFGTRKSLGQAGLEIPAILEVLLGGWDQYVRGVMKFGRPGQGASEPRDRYPLDKP